MRNTSEKLRTKQPEIVKNFYDLFYKTDLEDSPDLSRHTLAVRALEVFSLLGKNDFVLDLGAGRQIFEMELFQGFGRPNWQLVTVDFADIDSFQLLTSNPRTAHLRANGDQLPFGDNTFSGALSNMALDFMPEQTIEELLRVLKPGACLLINLHHPSLFSKTLDRDLSQVKRQIKIKEQKGGKPRKRWLRQINVLEYHRYLRDNSLLFGSEDEILSHFGGKGFLIQGVREASDEKDKWWEVDLIKPED